MDVESILDIPQDELKFYQPLDAPPDRFDPRFKTLRVERRGLRRWTSFEEDPAYLDKFKKLPIGFSSDWKPTVPPWARYLGSETNMVDLLKSTLILRLNIALHAASSRIAIIGTPRHFPSYGNDDNRLEGGPEGRIGPDLFVVDGDPTTRPLLRDLKAKILMFGEAKVKDSRGINDVSNLLPRTLGCYESWLAQAVQCCTDLNISLGWVQTNREVVLFHLSRIDNPQSQNHAMTTRSSNLRSLPLASLQSDPAEEPEYSSPVVRQTEDWLNFGDGDSDIPFISDSIENMRRLTPMRPSNCGPRPPTAPLKYTAFPYSPFGGKRTRETTPEEPDNSQESLLPPTPCPPPRAVPNNSSPGDSLFSPLHIATRSPSEFTEDTRGDDATHVFIKSYPLEDRNVGKRLFELIMLAKRAADLKVLHIGPWKLSHSALDALEAARRKTPSLHPSTNQKAHRASAKTS
ncbi:hypothetical protein GQX73_g8874 [Xylaria multiplex]|uniref:Uncharacterized protein n=1 Tax=Xylaria multiplex TaxID=323545 RepID=A0A7C8MNC8_9PEZI|nr:hypothetical protein GQX73_g8874 [Xylaria multiplex]